MTFSCPDAPGVSVSRTLPGNYTHTHTHTHFSPFTEGPFNRAHAVSGVNSTGGVVSWDSVVAFATETADQSCSLAIDRLKQHYAFSSNTQL